MSMMKQQPATDQPGRQHHHDGP